MLEYLKVPQNWIVVVIGAFCVMQCIGEFLEFKGKIVPEFLKIRKYFQRKKKEREVLAEMPTVLAEVKTLLNNVDQHYSADNITKRDNWMQWVNDKSKEYDNYGACLAELRMKMDENNAITLSLLIENKRSAIIDFASKVIDEKYPVTREQFNRVFKTYKEYEEIIEQHHLTNGETDIAIRIIQESYEQPMRNHTFVEDVRGY